MFSVGINGLGAECLRQGREVRVLRDRLMHWFLFCLWDLLTMTKTLKQTKTGFIL